MTVSDLTVVVLERDRHDDLIAELRESGSARRPHPRRRRRTVDRRAQPFTGIDMLMGIGGTPEGVISAAAIKCLGGAIQGRLWPRNEERAGGARRRPASISAAKLTHDDLVAGDDVFVAATGVTGGSLLAASE